MRECPHCHVMQTCDNFQLAKSGNRSGWCRDCRTDKERKRRLASGVRPKNLSRIEGLTKLCTSCLEFLPFDSFSPSVRGLGGLATKCKPCHAGKYRDKDRARTNTANYRERHRERHLAMHRVNMFRRRTKKDAASDGTVTDEFLKTLYAATHCAYCHLPVDREDRTADHVVALNSGGAHSSHNLVMACLSCNSSKRDMSVLEFRMKLSKSGSWFKKYTDYYV